MELNAADFRTAIYILPGGDMRLIKFLLLSALVLCVGLPLLFVLLVLGMAALGIVFGLGMALIGTLIAVIKLALMIILPIALVVWLFNRSTQKNRVY